MSDRRRFVAIDLETGGLDPYQYPITEVGLVAESHDGFVKEVTFSLPFELEECDPESLKIQNYWERHILEDYPKQIPLLTGATLLHELLDDVHVIAKNPSFDLGFVTELLHTHGLKPSWHHRTVDIGPLVWGWRNAWCRQWDYPPVQEPPNVKTVGEWLGIKLQEDVQHAALPDARWAYDVFRHIVPRD